MFIRALHEHASITSMELFFSMEVLIKRDETWEVKLQLLQQEFYAQRRCAGSTSSVRGPPLNGLTLLPHTLKSASPCFQAVFLTPSLSATKYLVGGRLTLGNRSFPVGVIITMHLCRVPQLSPPLKITSEILLVCDLIQKHTSFQTGFLPYPIYSTAFTPPFWALILRFQPVQIISTLVHFRDGTKHAKQVVLHVYWALDL